MRNIIEYDRLVELLDRSDLTEAEKIALVKRYEKQQRTKSPSALYKAFGEYFRNFAPLLHIKAS